MRFDFTGSEGQIVGPPVAPPVFDDEDWMVYAP